MQKLCFLIVFFFLKWSLLEQGELLFDPRLSFFFFFFFPDFNRIGGLTEVHTLPWVCIWLHRVRVPFQSAPFVRPIHLHHGKHDENARWGRLSAGCLDAIMQTRLTFQEDSTRPRLPFSPFNGIIFLLPCVKDRKKYIYHPMLLHVFTYFFWKIPKHALLPPG